MASELGDFLRDARKRSGRTLQEVAENLKKSVQFLSFVETGDRRPSLESLPDIAAAYRVSLEDLQKVFLRSTTTKSGADSPPSVGGPLRLGLVHNVWSAPAFLLLRSKEQLEGLRVTSYGKMQGADGAVVVPHWHSAESSPIMAGPGLVAGDRSRIEGMGRWEPDVQLRAYTVADLIGLMNAKSPMLDGIVAAFDPIHSYGDDLIQCARTMYAYGGCTLIWVGEEKKLRQSNKLLDCGKTRLHRKQWRKRILTDALPILYAPGTVAQQHVPLLDVPSGIRRKKAVGLERFEVDLNNFDALQLALLKLLKEKGEAVLLAWEPQISWLIARLEQWRQSPGKPSEPRKSDREKQSEQLVSALDEWRKSGKQICWFEPRKTRFLVSETAKLPYMTFDLIFRRDLIESPAQRASVAHLITRLDAASKRLTEIKADPNAVEVRWIASYLKMSAPACSAVLSDKEFCVLYHREWAERIRK